MKLLAEVEIISALRPQGGRSTALHEAIKEDVGRNRSYKFEALDQI
ncbi:hypothetical protein ACQZ6Z_22370 [Agrobacterium vitis]